ncbi:MAG: hypothetical protein LAT50_20330 [Ectothiorhodospiraceae bacterium]|nr:hypothetical protein [Ectothiorhodospiraceae bacterium]
MRAFFILLLLANLLLLGWFMFGHEQPETVAQPPRPVSGSLTLLSEADPDQLQRQVVEDNDAVPDLSAQPVPTTPPDRACYLSQAFAEQREARQLRDAAGDGAQVQEAPESELIGHWVYLPPADSVAVARENIDQLREAGIEDVGIVGDAAYRNAISLGVFSSAERARARQEAMREAGFAAEVGERYRSVTRYRVVLWDRHPDELPAQGDWEPIDCQAVSD